MWKSSILGREPSEEEPESEVRADLDGMTGRGPAQGGERSPALKIERPSGSTGVFQVKPPPIPKACSGYYSPHPKQTA